MKISILQKNLRKGVSIVGHITSKNINLPILNNIKLEAKDKSINLIATNLEMGITHSIRGKAEKEGDILLDSKILTNYISLLPNNQVNIEQKDSRVLIKCGNYNTTINGQSGEEFPLLPVVNKDKYYAVDAELLKKALTQVIFAVSANEARLDMSGVLFQFNQKELFLVATDSYRLAEKRIKINSSNFDDEDVLKKIIVPAKTVQEVIRVLSNIGSEDDAIEEIQEVKLCISENQVLFCMGATSLISRLLEGQFPDYKQVIPEKIKTEALISKNEITRATKAAALFSQSTVNDITLDFPRNKNKIIVLSSSGQVGENIIEIDAQVQGEDNSLVLSYRYLLDGLNNIEGENVKFETIDKNSPCILRPENDDSYIYIIMPIKQ